MLERLVFGRAIDPHYSQAPGLLTGASAAATPLFGGALTCALPASWLDCSDARPVPDHQEVWLERDGKCRSLIIEILELAEEATDDAREEPEAQQHDPERHGEDRVAEAEEAAEQRDGSRLGGR